MKSKWSFDGLVLQLLFKTPLIGERLGLYYVDHAWFQRFVKFGVSTTVLYWLIRAPMIWFFTEVMPFQVFFIPTYVMGTFVTGLILAIVGFAVSESWVWKRKAEAVTRRRRR